MRRIASSHVTVSSLPWRRISGCVRRSALAFASQACRPFGPSRPWFTRAARQQLAGLRGGLPLGVLRVLVGRRLVAVLQLVLGLFLLRALAGRRGEHRGLALERAALQLPLVAAISQTDFRPARSSGSG